MMREFILKNTMQVCFIGIVVMLSSVYASAQNAATDPLLQQFDSYRQAVLQEKLFLHTDKNSYLSGEICWFKIYNVDAAFNRPLSLSKLAYTEVLDKNNKPVLQAKITLKDGDGNGSLQLPVTLPSGRYKLRAYTNWMKNFGTDYFFEKALTIINPKKIYEEDTVKAKDDYDIRFFPEGGNLVNGIRSKLAFRVVNQNGKGITCYGGVMNEKGDTVATYATLKFGMGNFEFTPEEGHSYKAFIILSDGRKTTRDLPVTYNNGYAMQLVNEGNYQLKITVRTPLTNNGISPVVYLFAHTRSSVKLVLSGNIQSGHAEFLVDKNKLGDGISHFTVFNADRHPVCERLFFKYPSQNLRLGINADQQAFELRKKINLHISSGDDTQQPVAADMSMAVYRIDSLQGLDDADISSYLWLSSDLAGSIESPGYYFSNDGIGTEEAMDNLMLTSGWRRFRWEEIQQNKKPVFEFIPEYKGHIITGKVVKTSSGAAAPGVNSFLSVPGTRTQFRTAVSAENGRIKFDMDQFYNVGEIIVQTNNQEDSIYNIEITSPFLNTYSTSPLSAFSISQTNAAALLNQDIGLQVQNIYSGNKLKQFKLPALDTNAFYFKPDYSYLLDNYVRFTTMEEILREYVAPVAVRRRGTKFQLPVFDELRRQFFATTPLILLDGVPVFDVDKFMQYDPLKMRKMDVMSQTYFLGNMLFQGVVNCTTYNGDLNGYELDPHATVIDYEGLQLQRDFYSPVYETQLQADSRLPDFRNLLYWSPEVRTDEKGKQDVSFYTSDLPGKYAVVLQGLSAAGKPGSKVIMIDVKEPVSVTRK